MIARSISRAVAGTARRTAVTPTASAQSRLLHTTQIRRAQSDDEQPPPAQNKPTFDSRTSPRQGSISETKPQHPGYTNADAPVTSAHPKEMPAAKGRRASETDFASAHTEPQHPGVREMAKGAETAGSDAIKPEDRNVKGWGPNARSGDFNKNEGKRNPVLHGGSNEGGHDKRGKSKT